MTVLLPFSLPFSLFVYFLMYRATEAFIRSKYERKQYLKKDGLPPSRPTTTSNTKETKPADKVINVI